MCESKEELEASVQTSETQNVEKNSVYIQMTNAAPSSSPWSCHQVKKIQLYMYIEKIGFTEFIKITGGKEEPRRSRRLSQGTCRCSSTPGGGATAGGATAEP